MTDERAYRGRVSYPKRERQDLDLDALPFDTRLAVVLRRAAEQYDRVGLAALPAVLRRAAAELDAVRYAAHELLAPTEGNQ